MFDAYYFPIAGKVFLIFFAWWIGLISYSHYQLIRSYRTVSKTKKNQIKYFFLATAIGFSGGSLCYLPNFGFEIYPWGNFAVFLYPIIMSYAILKYNLMEVRLLFRRTALLAAIYLALITLAMPIVLFLHKMAVNPPNISISLLALEALFSGAVLSFGPFLYAYFIRKSAYFHEHTIAGLTHELKSPLGIIESAINALIHDLDGDGVNKEKFSSYLAMIQTNTVRLQGFAQNLIHVAKGEGDDIAPDLKQCDLAQIVMTACDHWRPQAAKKQIALTFEGLTQAPMSGDAIKLHQVISNLLSNAIKFSDGGRIRVKIKEDEQNWTCSIQDEGRGISVENLKKVFNKFYQERPGIHGTGIGLTIAKAWVEAHGGKIWAESEGEGKGTTVRFTLPL